MKEDEQLIIVSHDKKIVIGIWCIFCMEFFGKLFDIVKLNLYIR